MAFLDEATSALDAENSRRLYEALQSSGATYITVAHTADLRKYHSHVLELFKDGSYEFRRIRNCKVVLPYEGESVASTPASRSRTQSSALLRERKKRK